MKAVQLTGHGIPGKFNIGEVADPFPNKGEVVVRVRACGLNHLDLWLEEGGLPMAIELPRIPGCEIAGEVSSVGSEVGDWQPGDRVAVQSNLFCGECEYCLAGEESICLNGRLVGVDQDGGFAEQVVVPARLLVRIPEGVSFETSAALTLAGSTAMHMLMHRIQVRPGHWVLVIGAASGVGSAAIQIALKLGGYVIATGSTESKRSLARKLGAQHVVDSTRDDWVSEVRRITNKRGVDVVVEHVGGPVIEQAFQCLARGGTVVTCGATAGRHIRLNLWPFFVKEHRLVGSYGRTRQDLNATLEWAAAGQLQPVIDEVLPLDQTPRAFERLRSRNVLGKLILRGTY